MLYLASKSPRRVQLLEQLGLKPSLVDGEIDETPKDCELGQAYVERMARAKAEAGFARLFAEDQALASVMGADTALVFDGGIIGKPADEEDAVRILQSLGGHTHEVVSSVALKDRFRCDVITCVSSVTFAALSSAQIADYIATGEGADKAGSYAIQGRAARFITRLEGSYSGVMGLPLYETSQLLERFGIEH